MIRVHGDAVHVDRQQLQLLKAALVERAQLPAAFNHEAGELHLPDAAGHAAALEERGCCTMANVFRVPASARWGLIRAQAKQADIGGRIDAALEAIGPTTRGETFVDQGQQRCEQQQRERSVAALERGAAALGFTLTPSPAPSCPASV